MRKTALAILLLSMCAAPALLAQTPTTGHGPNTAAMVQRRVKYLTTLLDLNPAEQTSLTDLLTKDAAGNQSFRTNLRAAQQALSTAEKNNDSNGMQAASAQIGTLMGQMALNRANFNSAIAQILTSEQLTKYKTLGEGRGPGRGFGGRGRPPVNSGTGTSAQ